MSTEPAYDQQLVSVIVPVCDRFDDLDRLLAGYLRALDASSITFEMIVVLDGSQAAQLDEVRSVAARDPRISVVALARRFGEAVATTVAYQNANGARILTLPAYHQVDDAAPALLLAALDHYDLAVARREPRAGGRLEALRRSVFHRALGALTKSNFRDLGCGARAMRRSVLDEIHLSGEQQRFLPVLADSRGFRVAEIAVGQSPLDRFKGVYTPHDYGRAGLDLLTMLFLVRFARKPLRLFGLIGTVTAAVGVFVLAWMTVERFLFKVAMADRPLLLLATLLVVLGVHLLALGLLGELIIYTNARQTRDYRVDRVVELRGRSPAAQNPEGQYSADQNSASEQPVRRTAAAPEA